MKLKLTCPELNISEENYHCLGVITAEKACEKNLKIMAVVVLVVCDYILREL